MDTATNIESAPQIWSEEPAKRPGRRRIRARIDGQNWRKACANHFLSVPRSGGGDTESNNTAATTQIRNKI